jgi:hypothetical protein
MNKEYPGRRRKNKMSMLLKFYIQKVFSKIKSPVLQKRSPGLVGKTGKAGSRSHEDKKIS